MLVSRLKSYGVIAAYLIMSVSLQSRANDAVIDAKTSVLAQSNLGLRLPPSNEPTYPGTAGLPSININDAHLGLNAAMPNGSATQLLQQNFPVPLKGSDADTFMPAGLLEKSLGPLAEPRKEAHIY